jgi:hypothetical protein
MRYALGFGSVSALCGVATAFAPWFARPFLVWVAVSFALVCAAYAGAGPSVLGKRVDGELPGWSMLLNGPFLLFGLASMRFVRAAEVDDAWNEVGPGLLLGRRPTRLDADRFRGAQVAAILDLCAELPITRARSGRERYRSMPVLDGEAPTPEQLSDAIAWIDAQRAAGPVYVHCALGHSRGATVAAAWRLAHGLDPGPVEAEAELRRIRATVELSEPQRSALQRYRATLPG